MEKNVLAKYFLRLSIFLLPLVLLITVTMNLPVYADSNSGGEKINKAAAWVTRHMDKMRQETKKLGLRTDLGVKQITDVEVSQIEQKLENGSMRPKEACSHCHSKGRDSKPKGR